MVSSGPTLRIRTLGTVAIVLFLLSWSGTAIPKVSGVSVNLTEWTLPDGNSGPWGIAVDQYSKVWFSENQTNRLASFDPVTNSLREWDIPTGGSAPRYVYIKPAATSVRVYFTEYGSDKVGYFENATNTFYEWALPAGRKPVGIAVDDSDNIWFTESANDAIGRINPIGNVLTEYKLPALPTPTGLVTCGSSTAQLCPWGISARTVQTTSGTNVIVWFTELMNNVVGRLEGKSGAVTLFNLGSINPFAYQPYDITVDSQGNAIFTSINDAANRISIIRNQTATMADIIIPTSQAKATSVKWDSSRSLIWFAEYRSGKVASLSTTGAVFTFLPNVIQCTIGGTNPGAPDCSSGSGISQPSTTLSTTQKTPKVTTVNPSLITTISPQISNQFTEYPLPTTTSGPNSVAIDSGGNIWVTEQTSSGNRIARITIVIPFDFSVSATPNAVTVSQGQLANYTVNVNLVSGTAVPVSLTVSPSPPSGVTFSFNPSSGTPTFSSTLSVGTTGSTATGTYPLTISATGGGVTRTATINLIVSALPPPSAFDFALAVIGASSASVVGGESASFSLEVTKLGTASTQTVQLLASGEPAGVTPTFDPATGLPPFTSILTVTTSVDTTPGTYEITITGTGGGQTHRVTVTLTISAPLRDFSLTVSPESMSIPQAASGTASLTVQSIGVFSSPVNLAASDVPAGVAVNFSPNPVTPSAGGITMSTVSITVTRSVGQGTYTFTISGTSGSLVRQVSVTLTVSGCLIATATYGSELAPEVQFLRDFRDNQVLNTFAGSHFMSVFNMWYYSYSPAAASYISGNQPVRTVMKGVLYPFIGILHVSAQVYSVLAFQPEIAVLAAGLVAGSLIGLIYLALPLSCALWISRRWTGGLSEKRVVRWFTAIFFGLLAGFLVSEILFVPAAMMVVGAALVLLAIVVGSLIPAISLARLLRRLC